MTTFAVSQASNGEERFRKDARGRFVNLDGTGSPLMKRVFKWAVIDRVMCRRENNPRRAPVAIVEADLDAIRTPPGPGQGARLLWLGHASWLIQVAGVSLLVDPALREFVPYFRRRNVGLPVTIEHLPRIDAQLVTHNHTDHMDMGTLRAVGAPIITGLGGGKTVRDRLPVTELGWWDSADVRGVRVTFVPSQHWSRRGFFDTNRALWGGMVIEGDGVSIYHSGDTAYAQATFTLIGRHFPKLDAALLPIGAYDPRWFMRHQHVDPAQALQAFVDLGARQALAMHWGTFKLTDEPMDEPSKLFQQIAAEMKLPPATVRVLAVGETVAVSKLANA